MLTKEKLVKVVDKISIPGCWLWTNGSAKRYGQSTAVGGKKVRMHRESYRLFYGEIPPGMLVLHRCDIRNCINPEHLFLGTHLDNTIDAWEKGRYFHQSQTHCKNGHEFTAENTVVYKTMKKCRICRICLTEYNKLRHK